MSRTQALYSSDLQAQIMEDAGDQVATLAARGFGIKAKSPKLNASTSYSIKVFWALAAFLNSIEAIGQSVVFLGTYRTSAKAKSEGITAAEYLEFAVENFLIRSQMAYDRALRLAATVSDLGIAIHQIRHDLVLSNERIKGGPVAGSLKRLSKCIKKYNHARNAVVHHGTWELDDVRMLKFAYKAAELLPQQSPAAKARMQEVKRAAPGARRALADLLANEYEAFVSELIPHAQELLDAVVQPYEHYSTLYRPRESSQ